MRIQDFRSKHKQVKWGVAVAWILNILLLTCTIEAAIIVTFLGTGTSTSAIVTFILYTLPISFIVGILAVAGVSFFSWKAIQMNSSKNLVEVRDGPIYNIVEEMVIASGGGPPHMPKVFVAADVPEPNAYALSGPFGSQIVFTHGIVSMLTRSELQAVAAHEWAHVLSGDSKAMTKLVALASVIGIVSGGLHMGFRRSSGGKSNIVAIIVIALAYLFLFLAPMLAAVSRSFMSRRREQQADVIAVKLTRDPSALARALKKISSTPQPEKSQFGKAAGELAFFGNALRTHPPMKERLETLRKLGADI